MAGFQELVSIETDAKPASLLCLDQKLTRVLFDWPGSYRAQIQEKKKKGQKAIHTSQYFSYTDGTNQAVSEGELVFKCLMCACCIVWGYSTLL